MERKRVEEKGNEKKMIDEGTKNKRKKERKKRKTLKKVE